jgi:hypothetical protein
MYDCMHSYMHAYMSAYRYTYTYTFTRTCACMCVDPCMCVYIHDKRSHQSFSVLSFHDYLPLLSHTRRGPAPHESGDTYIYAYTYLAMVWMKQVGPEQ